MVEHLWTIEHREERHIKRHTRYARLFVGLQVAITKLLSLEERALLVVALAIGDIAVTASIGEAIAVLEPTHSSLVVRIGGVVPAEHTLVDEFRTLATHVRTPVLKDEVCILGYCLDTLLVVIGDMIHSIVGSTAQAVTQVHTETIDLVLGEPIVERTNHHLLSRREIVVPILIDIIWVRRCDIKPWVVLEVITVRIELIHWVETRIVVEHHIEDHSDTTLVALINESLHLLWCTIGLVKREVVVR